MFVTICDPKDQAAVPATMRNRLRKSVSNNVPVVAETMDVPTSRLSQRVSVLDVLSFPSHEHDMTEMGHRWSPWQCFNQCQCPEHARSCGLHVISTPHG
jgi:hypothetical protein